MSDTLAPPVRAKGMVHKLVAETAKEMARCWYDEAAHDNDFYREHPNVALFVDRRWRNFIRHARANLAKLLSSSSVPEDQKAQIYEALIKDGAVNPARSKLIH
jgi:hypothetical protein